MNRTVYTTILFLSINVFSSSNVHAEEPCSIKYRAPLSPTEVAEVIEAPVRDTRASVRQTYLSVMIRTAVVGDTLLTPGWVSGAQSEPGSPWSHLWRVDADGQVIPCRSEEKACTQRLEAALALARKPENIVESCK